MKMMEAGLIFGKWQNERLPKVEECLPISKMRRDKTSEGRDPLPLEGFFGAFIIISLGSALALIAFFIETVFKRRKLKIRNGLRSLVTNDQLNDASVIVILKISQIPIYDFYLKSSDIDFD